jgi:NADH-quinone oxidoreductase subunit G
MVRRGGQLRPATWDEALDVVASKLKTTAGSLVALASPRRTNESLQSFADLFRRLGAKSVGSLNPVPEFMATAEGSLTMIDESDLYLVVGTDLDLDHQVAGIAVRRGVMNRGARLIILGPATDGLANMAHYTYKPDQIDQAIALAKGIDAPLVIYGAGAGELLPKLRQELSGKARFLGLVTGSNARGALAAGLNGSGRLDGAKSVFVLAGDDKVGQALVDQLAGAEFVVAQTCYQDALTNRADVVLPTVTWAETSGTFTNTEGRIQTLRAALKPLASVKDDQEILSALADRLG